MPGWRPEHFKTDHHEFILTPDFVDVVDDLVWHFDEPFADPSSLPTYHGLKTRS